jgi:hypothetical protein
LVAASQKATAAYKASVHRAAKEISAANETNQQQRAIAAAELRQAIAATEAEILRLEGTKKCPWKRSSRI